MARMIPPFYQPDTAPGERELFDSLASSSDTDGWLVLHSLAIASHIRQVEGEADFVVIVPGSGVLVIEVKSHLRASFGSDGWKLGADKPTMRGPFKQADEAQHSIREYLVKRGVDVQSIPMLSAAWFTAIRRDNLPESSEWHAWQMLDSEDLRRSASHAIRKIFAAGTAHLKNSVASLRYRSSGLDDDTARRIANLLRPQFEAAVVAGDLRRARETQLVAFVDEQYDALDSMEDNRAVLFTGPAGSGKTWLAMEAARREVARGRRGRLLCFNRLLGQHLRRQLVNEVEGLTVATFHQELLRLSGRSAPPDATAAYWESELPDAAIEVLLDSASGEVGDFLIIDEAQDLARAQYLDVLDLMVTGGLTHGRVLMFGDFERQAIYESGDGRDSLVARLPDLSSFRLNVNCRNLPRIGAAVERMCRMVPGYGRFRRPDDGADPEFIPGRRGTDQSLALAEAVQQLQDEGYQLDEIVVLSPLKRGSTAETTTHPRLQQILRPVDGSSRRPGQLRYSTVHAFKGLEAPAVIVTDLDGGTVPNFEAILYIALTRATDRLFALIDPQTFRSIQGRDQ